MVSKISSYIQDITSDVSPNAGVSNLSVIKMGNLVFVACTVTASSGDIIISGLPTSRLACAETSSRGYIAKWSTTVVAGPNLNNDAFTLWYVA